MQIVNTTNAVPDAVHWFAAELIKCGYCIAGSLTLAILAVSFDSASLKYNAKYNWQS